MRLRRGDLIIEKLTPATGAAWAGTMLHHWRGTAFAAGAKAADFERLMTDFNAYPQHFSPQVVQAKVLSRQGDRFLVSMRVRQRHVITVVMDTDYDMYLRTAGCATRLQHFAEHPDCGDRLARHCQRARVEAR